MLEQRQVTLEDILAAKEQRKQRQDAMRLQYGTTLVSITINMPGPIKDTLLLRRLRDYAVERVSQTLAVKATWNVNLLTGPEALLAVQQGGAEAKSVCVAIESQHAFDRLLDLDVFDAEGRQISRRDSGQARKCLICGQQAVLCMRARSHQKDELQYAVKKLLDEFSANQTARLTDTAEKLGSLALEAMLFEVTCTPSPGLVDRVNSGAHKDMDFYTFMSSSAVLSSYLARCAQAGLAFGGQLPELLPILRLIGGQGEKAMLLATDGVNTQKGLLFCLGIVVASAGWVMNNQETATSDKILEAVAKIVQGIVGRELGNCHVKSSEQLTAGEKLYLEYGITGIRGEMEAGLPAVRQKALPALRQAVEQKLSLNDALLQTLLVLMMSIDDTTVMHRHDIDKMRIWVRRKAKQVLDLGGMYTMEGRQAIAQLDRQFIEENVSPGGAADLLAVTWFLYRFEKSITR